MTVRYVSDETDFKDPSGVYIECECEYAGSLIPIGYDADEVVVVCPRCFVEHQETDPRYRDRDDEYDGWCD